MRRPLLTWPAAARIAAVVSGFVVVSSCSGTPSYSLAGDAATPADGNTGPDGSADESSELGCSACLMFTSPPLPSGNLFGAGSIATVDALCTSWGRQIPGKQDSNWKAFLWYEGGSPFPRIRFPKDGFYSVKSKLTGISTPLFATIDAMKETSAPAALQTMHDGELIDSPYRVWTGGGATPSPENCENWTSDGTDKGAYGDPRDQWSFMGEWACSASGRVYCMEQ
ncbi:MAG: hypothetical protein U0174_23490 [Polyangiaceae bacterium]